MWRLRVGEGGPWVSTTTNHVGRQYWEFDPEAGAPEERAQVERMRREYTEKRGRNNQSADLLARMQLRKENGTRVIPAVVKVGERGEITAQAVGATLERALSYFSSIQSGSGHWPSQLSGGLFFMPAMIIMSYITGTLGVSFGPELRKEIIRYIHNHQNEDGGWGLHVESDSTMFGTTENYLALRLLGESREDSIVAKARKWILDRGGAVGICSWGKFWLTVLGVYEWSGFNPVPPEFCLLPNSFFFNPGKMLALARTIYLPMSFLYGKRFVGPITDLVLSLRQELYIEPYSKINWNKARNTIAKEDNFYPHPLLQDMLWTFLHRVAEPILSCWPFSMLRDKALKLVSHHLDYEDKATNYLCLASEEKMMSMVACWAQDPSSEAFKRHLARVPDYIWISEDGAKCQGNGSQIWDTAFAVRAIISAGLNEKYAPTLRKAHEFLKASQIREDPPGNFRQMYRQKCKGGWVFGDADQQSWIVSDCTAETLKAVLLLSQVSPALVGEKMDSQCLYDAVNVLLPYQSNNGGFSAWEPRKAFSWLEKLNPIEFLQDALIEREYVECTSSVIQGLVAFKKLYPHYRQKEINNCVSKGLSYIENTQNPDGSWYGRWGICYTYGTWFALEALGTCGINYSNSLGVRKACQFLLSKQLPDGGWGESYLSCRNEVYTNLEGNISNLVQTSWALLGLIAAGQAKFDPKPIQKGIRLLINAQLDDGDFPQQGINGAFMKNGALNYSAYRNIFTIWALGEYRRCVLSK